MNRIDFMGQLERLLQDIPIGDRQDAIDYYNSYFDEAGSENEASVIQELGSPGKVAGIIKADLRENGTAQTSGEYTETGYQDNRYREAHQVPTRRETGYREPQQKRKIPLALVIILVIFTFPIWGGLGAGILGVLVGIAGVFLGLMIAGAVGGAGCIVGGVVAVVFGIIRMFISPAQGCLTIGVGLLTLVLGILFMLFFIWLTFRWIPSLFRWFVDLCQRLLNRNKGGAEE